MDHKCFTMFYSINEVKLNNLDKMKKLKQAKAEAKTDLEKLTTEHELKYKDIEVFRFRIFLTIIPR